ncbi:hypothetical protein ACHWQZ_G015300 [Mnemiopsis leidyi]
MKKGLEVVLLIFLLQLLGGETSAERRFKALKFGQTENDYVMFQSDMSPFETSFTVCSWIRKLCTRGTPTWFSYATTGETFEIQIGDDGVQTLIFGDNSDLNSLYTVSPGNWLHNCMSWDTETQRRDVYLDGVLIDSKATPAGRTVGLGGTILLGNEQDIGPGAGMDGGDRFGETSAHALEERIIKWEDILQKTRTGTVTEIDSGCTGQSCLRARELKEADRKLNETLTELNKTTKVLQQTEQSLKETLTELEEIKQQKEVCSSDLRDKELQLNATILKLEQAKEEVVSLRSSLEKTEEELNSTRVEKVKIALQLNSTEEEKQKKMEELERKNEELTNITGILNQTQVELGHVKDLLEKAASSTVECALNSTVSSYWDLLYSEEFFGSVITAEKVGVLQKSAEKLEFFEGVRVTDGMIRFFKFFHDGDDHCPN